MRALVSLPLDGVKTRERAAGTGANSYGSRRSHRFLRPIPRRLTLVSPCWELKCQTRLAMLTCRQWTQSFASWIQLLERRCTSCPAEHFSVHTPAALSSFLGSCKELLQPWPRGCSGPRRHRAYGGAAVSVARDMALAMEGRKKITQHKFIYRNMDHASRTTQPNLNKHATSITKGSLELHRTMQAEPFPQGPVMVGHRNLHRNKDIPWAHSVHGDEQSPRESEHPPRSVCRGMCPGRCVPRRLAKCGQVMQLCTGAVDFPAALRPLRPRASCAAPQRLAAWPGAGNERLLAALEESHGLCHIDSEPEHGLGGLLKSTLDHSGNEPRAVAPPNSLERCGGLIVRWVPRAAPR